MTGQLLKTCQEVERKGLRISTLRFFKDLCLSMYNRKVIFR